MMRGVRIVWGQFRAAHMCVRSHDYGDPQEDLRIPGPGQGSQRHHQVPAEALAPLARIDDDARWAAEVAEQELLSTSC
jgi:hypothetical protein